MTVWDVYVVWRRDNGQTAQRCGRVNARTWRGAVREAERVTDLPRARLCVFPLHRVGRRGKLLPKWRDS